MDQHRIFCDLLIEETRRRLMGEGVPRIRKCLSELDEAEIWLRPNDHSNAVGNLVLHLCGNVRQWIVSTLGERPDYRQRQLEFDERGPIPATELMRRLDEVMSEVEEVLERLTPNAILKKYEVQGFHETGLSILVHVVEHFSYHTGQITYFVKWRKDMDVGYYEDLDLDVTS